LVIFRSEENTEYNDIPLIYEEKHYETLIKGGIDQSLAKHIAHLFIRDPVSLFSEKINQDNTKDSDHFEVCGFIPYYSTKHTSAHEKYLIDYVILEYSVNQLANYAVQTSSSRKFNWMESRI
jgi:hypothetical protein